jgi:hypothetical protein
MNKCPDLVAEVALVQNGGVTQSGWKFEGIGYTVKSYN